jgi:hypothetical protein
MEPPAAHDIPLLVTFRITKYLPRGRVASDRDYCMTSGCKPLEGFTELHLFLHLGLCLPHLSPVRK